MHTLALLVILIAIGMLGWLIPSQVGSGRAAFARTLGWLVTLVLLTVFLMVADRGITDRWEGLLIDERNKMTLSRLQMILWTRT